MIRLRPRIVQFAIAALFLVVPTTGVNAQSEQVSRKVRQQGYDATRTASSSARIDNRLQTRIDTRLDTRLDDIDTKVHDGLQSFTSAADTVRTPVAKSAPRR